MQNYLSDVSLGDEDSWNNLIKIDLNVYKCSCSLIFSTNLLKANMGKSQIYADEDSGGWHHSVHSEKLNNGADEASLVQKRENIYIILNSNPFTEFEFYYLVFNWVVQNIWPQFEGIRHLISNSQNIEQLTNLPT